jgi:hypothetical protein
MMPFFWSAPPMRIPCWRRGEVPLLAFWPTAAKPPEKYQHERIAHWLLLKVVDRRRQKPSPGR